MVNFLPAVSIWTSFSNQPEFKGRWSRRPYAGRECARRARDHLYLSPACTRSTRASHGRSRFHEAIGVQSPGPRRVRVTSGPPPLHFTEGPGRPACRHHASTARRGRRSDRLHGHPARWLLHRRVQQCLSMALIEALGSTPPTGTPRTAPHTRTARPFHALGDTVGRAGVRSGAPGAAASACWPPWYIVPHPARPNPVATSLKFLLLHVGMPSTTAASSRAECRASGGFAMPPRPCRPSDRVRSILHCGVR